MPRYRQPGVYIKEVSSGNKNIQGTPTSLVAFVGSTFRGSGNQPRLIGSWKDYISEFGDLSHPSGVSDEGDHMALAVRAFYQNGGKEAYICPLVSHSHSVRLSSALKKQFTMANSADLRAREYSDFCTTLLRHHPEVSVLVLPDLPWLAENIANEVVRDTLACCEAAKHCMLLVDPPLDTPLKTTEDIEALALPRSSYSVMYYPWVEVDNPFYHPVTNAKASRTLAIPPSALAAAIWAKTDTLHGVWKAPAGANTQLAVNDLQYAVTEDVLANLNPCGVNCLRSYPGLGFVVWGARTLATDAEPQWRYIAVRRMAMFIEQSLLKGLQWVVFEPNNQPLWQAVTDSVSAFLRDLFQAGAFAGQKADDGFFVHCGYGETMSQTDLDNHQLVLLVGFAPLKPAEFVTLRLQLNTATP
ncbi:phage tail sheath family protein [Alteromonas sp. 14N.309.X.WAT.G.H12]|uniref:phage tail sheath family protein n=1 Tax=Alteromonas sp. 14N.309.X.WAT.G.H12 TaxID=3120824 RepID=UPI002FD299AD